MKVGETSGVAAAARGKAEAAISGPGWSVVTRGEFHFLRALPSLTGGQITEVSLTEAQFVALREGDVSAQELLLGSMSQGRLDKLDLSDAAQRAAQAGLVPGAGSQGRQAKARQAAGGASGGYDHRLTVAALVFAAAVFLFIYFGG